MDQYFTNTGINGLIKRVVDAIDSRSESDPFMGERNKHLVSILNSMQLNGEEWQARTPMNTELLGQALTKALETALTAEPNLTRLYALCYRFLKELDLSLRDSMAIELQMASQFAVRNIDKLDPDTRDQVLYALYAMPLDLLKRAQNSEVISTLRNWTESADKFDRLIAGWGASLDEREKRVTALSEALTKYETAYNFVGLHEGFNELGKDKKKTLNWQRVWLIAFGAAVLAPFATTLYVGYEMLSRLGLEQLKGYFLIAAIPAASLTVILLYYFRVALLAVNSTKSQLLQIDLRKTLCRFIESYANYSHAIKVKNADSLAKFEGVIFSSIVSTDAKIPPTFDGIDQVGEMIKTLRGSP